MRKFLLLSFFVLASTLSYAQLTVEKIMKDPSKWIGTSPSNVFWSEDSKTIYFMWNPDQNPADSLYKITLTNKTPQKVSLEERQSLPSGFGSTYSKNSDKKLYFKNGDLFVQDLTTFKEKQLTKTLDRKSNASFNKDESKVVFNQSNNLYSIDFLNGQIEQLTNFSSDNNKRPEAKLSDSDKALEKDQLELSEVLRSGKEKRESREKHNKATQLPRPKTINLDGKNLQNLQASPDLNFVTYRLMEPAKGAKSTVVPNYVTESGYTENLPTRTKVGSPAASFESFIYDIKRDSVYKIVTKDIPGINELPKYLDEYPKDTTSKKPTARKVIINGPIWSPEGENAVVVVRSQDNKDRWIMKLDPATGKLSLIDRQRDEAWVAGPGIGHSMGVGNVGFTDETTLYFQSEESGYSHLYTIDLNGGAKKQLTSGKFEIQSADLSKDKQFFYLKTNEVHPGETHFYKMAVNGGDRVKITQMSGGNEVTLSPDEKTLALRYSNTNTPWELYLQENNPTAKAEKVTSSLTDSFKAYKWKQPQVISFKATDGQDIYARVYEPTKKAKNGKAVIFVHGAGYLQNAHKWWSQYFREYMFHNLLVDQGYTVLDMDFRASSGYGREVRTGIYRHMGGKDLTDNVDGAKLLTQKYGINPKKIGIYGGSYGGFITLMAMFTTPDVFAAGAALRPVTDWAAYNHGYTSNILNEPQTDSLAYRRSSPIFHAEGLKGNLLICHGTIDVNVHIQDSYRLAQRLIELRKEDWEMASYPLEDHGFVHPTSWMDEYKRILKLFQKM